MVYLLRLCIVFADVPAVHYCLLAWAINHLARSSPPGPYMVWTVGRAKAQNVMCFAVVAAAVYYCLLPWAITKLDPPCQLFLPVKWGSKRWEKQEEWRAVHENMHRQVAMLQREDQPAEHCHQYWGSPSIWQDQQLNFYCNICTIKELT